MQCLFVPAPREASLTVVPLGHTHARRRLSVPVLRGQAELSREAKSSFVKRIPHWPLFVVLRQIILYRTVLNTHPRG